MDSKRGCDHENVEWHHAKREEQNGKCMDCQMPVYRPCDDFEPDLAATVFSNTPHNFDTPITEREERDEKAERILDERMDLDPFRAKKERRLGTG